MTIAYVTYIRKHGSTQTTPHGVTTQHHDCHLFVGVFCFRLVRSVVCLTLTHLFVGVCYACATFAITMVKSCTRQTRSSPTLTLKYRYVYQESTNVNRNSCPENHHALSCEKQNVIISLREETTVMQTLAGMGTELCAD